MLLVAKYKDNRVCCVCVEGIVVRDGVFQGKRGLFPIRGLYAPSSN